MIILGQLAASHRAAVNKTTFYFNGQRICCSMFLYLHNISRARLTALISHYSTKGMTPRTHGNTKRLTHNLTSYDTIKKIVRFILNLAEEQALVLRVPGYHRSDLQLLPSSTSKSAICLNYCESCSDNRKAVSHKTFCSLWQELVPHIIIMKPMTDLCWECPKNSTLIQRTSNTTNEEKSAAIEKAMKHICQAETKRKSYNTITAECKSVIRSMYDVNGSFFSTTKLHYSTLQWALKGPLFIQLCPAGTLCGKTNAARAYIIPHTTEMFTFWGMLRVHSKADQLFMRQQ